MLVGYANTKEDVIAMLDPEAWGMDYIIEFTESIPFEV